VSRRAKFTIAVKILPLGEGGKAETLFRLDGWGSNNWVGGWATLLASPFGRGVLRKQDGEGVPPWGGQQA